MSDPNESSTHTTARDPLEASSAEPPRPVLLFAPGGLRPLWGIALFYVLVQVFETILIGFLPFPRTNYGAASPSSLIASEAAFFAAAAIATLILSLIERRSIALYGFRAARALPRFVAGLLWGILSLSLLIGILRASHALTFDARLVSGASIARYAALWAVGFLFVALFEETYVRGYLQTTLARGLNSLFELRLAPGASRTLGFWVSAVILSIFFGANHRSNPGETPLGLISAALIGLLFCLSLWRTGSLWWAIGFHTAWDWAQSFLFGVGDSGAFVQGRLFATHPSGPALLSGGTTGPEGSLYVLPVTAVLAAILLLTRPSSLMPDGSERQPSPQHIDAPQ